MKSQASEAFGKLTQKRTSCDGVLFPRAGTRSVQCYRSPLKFAESLAIPNGWTRSIPNPRWKPQ
jgi:hypothetical protein